MSREMLNYNGTVIGTVVIRQDSQNEKCKYTIQIRQGNCLAVLIHVLKIKEGEQKGQYRHTLYTFFANEQHLKNLLKNEGAVLFDEVVSIKLNMFYKENYTLLKYFVLSGYEVKCYYQVPQTSTKNEI